MATMIHADPAHEAWFCGGLVVYGGTTVPLTQDIRSVAQEHGIVSEEYAAALAQYVRSAFACQWALAESGIAGPQVGRRSTKPVGMVCLAVAGPGISGDGNSAGTINSRATVEAGDGAEFTCAQETPRRVSGVQCSGGERVWTTTRALSDAGRRANQRQFALESLRFLWQVLAAQPQ